MARAPFESVLRWDAELARLGRGVGRFNLEIGVALERLKRKGWHRELGYSSLDGYALERCSRTGRWAAEATALARRLEPLPQLRGAVLQGRVSLSMATLVSVHANAETDEFMTAKAQRCTVRQMRLFFRGLAVRNERVDAVGSSDGEVAGGADGGAVAGDANGDTVETVQEWVERAQQRTVKHLREEVDRALELIRSSGRAGCRPPSEEHMQQLAEVERALLTGEVELRSDWPVYSRQARGGSGSANTNGAPRRAAGSGGADATQMSGGGDEGEGNDATQMSGGGGGSRRRGARVKGTTSLGWLLGLIDEHGNPTAAHVKGGGAGGEDLEAVLAAVAKELCVGTRTRGARNGDVTITLWLTRETYWFWK